MDQEKIKRTVRRMTEARAELMKENAFFGHLAMGLGLACAPCGTACTDGNRLIFDPEFAEKLSDREIKFVILHELLHCVLEHCIRAGGRLQKPYNIACDEVVNSTILGMWGLDSFLLDGTDVMHQAPDGKEGRLHNAEEIYDMLVHRRGESRRRFPQTAGISGMPAGVPKSAKPDTSKNPGGSRGTGSLGTGSPGAGDPGAGSPVAGDPEQAGFDRHDLWQGICNRESLRDKWNEKIQHAAKDCGDMPDNIRRMVKELTKRSNLDWKQLLHDFLQFDEYDYSYLPPDRRFSGADFFLPAYNINPDIGSAKNIWVCVDISGSVSNEELSEAMAEILDAMRQTGLSGMVSFFHCNITAPVLFETEDLFREITLVGGGGTNFQIIFDYLKENLQADLPKAILIFTDGYAEYPREDCALGIPVLWIISKNGVNNVPWGHMARM